MKKIIIAIDGYSSCGKSTLAKALAKELHYAYVDTGAMYRSVTSYFLDNNVEINNHDAVIDALNHIEIHFERTKTGNHVFLNGKDIEEEIRTMRISEMVSPVATLSDVRLTSKEDRQMYETRNVIRVKDYQKYGSEVKILDGDEEEILEEKPKP